MKTSRRSFFATLAFALASLFVPKGKPTLIPKQALTKTFNPRYLQRYEGKHIPKNVVFAQPCGRFNPASPQVPTQKLHSVTKLS